MSARLRAVDFTAPTTPRAERRRAEVRMAKEMARGLKEGKSPRDIYRASSFRPCAGDAVGPCGALSVIRARIFIELEELYRQCADPEVAWNTAVRFIMEGGKIASTKMIFAGRIREMVLVYDRSFCATHRKDAEIGIARRAKDYCLVEIDRGVDQGGKVFSHVPGTFRIEAAVKAAKAGSAP